jgi:hypothetical protein
MKRTFLWDFKAVVPILEFDFRVTVVALQAVRGHLLEKATGPDNLTPDDRILANFLDLPLTPQLLPLGSDFTPFENRYTSKISELTGFPSLTKNFQSDGKSLRDFAEHRLGTSLEGALFLSLQNFHRSGRAEIPSFGSDQLSIDLLQVPITATDFAGLGQVLEVILNPQLETGPKIIKMNPTIEQEFPNFLMLKDPSIVGKNFGDVISDAVSSNPVGRLKATV